MSFPNEKTLKEMRMKLKKAKPSLLLPKNASQSQIIKYKICEKFVIYILENKISQSALAKKLKTDPSRINEIVKYRIQLFTIDKLLDLAEQLELELNLKVA